MKKNLATLSVLMGLTLSLTGCLSTQIDFNQYKPTAILSISAEDDIIWADEERSSSTGLLNGVINKKVNEKASDQAKKALEFVSVLFPESEKMIVEAFENSGKATFIDKDTVVNSESYKNLYSNKVLDTLETAVTPENYRIIYNPRDVDYVSFSEETGAKSFMYITMDFRKTMSTGLGKTGTMKALVTTSIELYDENKKIIAWSKGTGVSSKTAGVVMGAYDSVKLMELFPEAIKKSLEDAVSKL